MEQIYLYFLILVIPFLAQISILAIYKKYKSLKNKKGISGFEVARAFLDSHGLESLYIVESKGAFTESNTFIYCGFSWREHSSNRDCCSLEFSCDTG